MIKPFAQPVWTSTGAFSARKNYFDGRGKQSYLVDNTAWEGTNAKGEKVRMVTMSMRFVILQQFQEQRSKLFALTSKLIPKNQS